MGLHGAVATSQPLATQAGVAMLISGGNAVDAAVAAAAVLTVVEPMMTGLGGDCFAIIFNAESGEIHALNASGRAPQSATAEAYMRLGLNSIPETGILSVTVPGLVDGWAQLIAHHGTKDLAEVLSPAIEYAENGFPVSEIVSRDWHDLESKLAQHHSTAKAYLSNGRPPRPGEILRQPDLSRSLKVISLGGKDEFYHGELAERIASFCKAEGGFLTKDDLAMHKSNWVKPITASYRGYKLYELPPNTIGICAIMALNIIEGYSFGSIDYHSEFHLHLLIEAIKLSFADMAAYVADPDQTSIPTDGLLSKEYAEQRRQNIKDNVIANIPVGDPFRENDTVYLTVVDGKGNAVSLINSLYDEFGSGLVVDGTGICLQNRGSLFSLNPKHPNCIAPGKRPLHTLAPALVLTDGKLFMSFGVRGGWMQPQGHVQVLNNIVDFGMNPQTALDSPRFRYLTGHQVALEKPLLERAQDSLISRGHDIVPKLPKGMSFGGGQIILKDPQTGSLVAGSDPRTDGCAAAI
jgi:gamma-glutamyltranspeptidase/glutathione hydrolase